MTHLHTGKCTTAFSFLPISFLFLAVIASPFATPVASADLTRKQIEILENQFLPAWKIGDTWGVYESMNKAVRSMNAEQLVELDELLLKQDIPMSSQLLLESRLTLLQQNSKAKLPTPGIQEVLLTLRYVNADFGLLKSEADQLMESIDAATNETSFDKFDDLLWEAHVKKQQLRSSLLLAQYASTAKKRVRKNQLSKLTEEQQNLVAVDFESMLDELQTMQKKLVEYELVARIKRLNHANSALVEASDRKEKILAARAVDQDGYLIMQMLAELADVEFEHDMLLSDKLNQELQLLSSRGQRLAGEKLLTQSRLLFEGLHWWYRGRYGEGTDGFGLLKSPAALTSAEAAFALYMPQETVVPTDPSDESRHQVPEVDRRHNYIWAWEYRTLRATESATRIGSKSSTVVGSFTDDGTGKGKFF